MKTRTSLADLSASCAPKIYIKELNEWVANPNGLHGGLYIGTEMELLEEIDPIIWAYMADVPQEHIEFNMYEEGEEERVDEAIRILEEESNIWLEYVPEYDVNTLTEIIEMHKINHNIDHVWFDYIHVTVELISEYGAESNGSRMVVREDQVLASLSNKLKNLSREFDVSIDAGTQVNENIKDEKMRDTSVVRGAKSLVDKADSASVATRPTEKELKATEEIRREFFGDESMPNLIYNVYKNRGGKWVEIKIWIYVDYDTMRMHDLFVTDKNNKLITDIEPLVIDCTDPRFQEHKVQEEPKEVPIKEIDMEDTYIENVEKKTKPKEIEESVEDIVEEPVEEEDVSQEVEVEDEDTSNDLTDLDEEFAEEPVEEDLEDEPIDEPVEEEHIEFTKDSDYTVGNEEQETEVEDKKDRKNDLDNFFGDELDF